MLVGSPRYAIDKLQCVLNAAARLFSGTRKFDRGLSRLLHDDLHWLDIPERVQFKLGVIVHRCLQGSAPHYLADSCTLVSEVASRQRLRSASRRQLLIPQQLLSTFGRRAFSVAGPTVWNSLPVEIRDTASSTEQFSTEQFRRLLQTFFVQRIRGFYDYALYKFIIYIYI